MASPFNSNGGGLSLWNKLEVTDEKFSKRFDKGNFKGTAVDAVYNVKRVTEQLGPVGFAWGWHIARDELVKFDAADEPTWIHNCVVCAWFRQPDGSFREVEHVGSTIAARYVGRGPQRRFMVDDEYAKKSVTDALSKIMVSLGASADIWLGRFDGNKYSPPEPEPGDEPLVEVATTQAPPRQTRQPSRPTVVPGESPQEAVDRANKRADENDPWKLHHAPADQRADLLLIGIDGKPWPEVTAAMGKYRQLVKLDLTPAQREAVIGAYEKRKADVQQQHLPMAG